MRKTAFWALFALIPALVLLSVPGGTWAQEGQKVFSEKCAPCHGETGKGDGPMASTFDPKPQDFCLPAFWQGNVDQKITSTVQNGKGQMVPVSLKPDELKAVIAYIKSSCKK